MPDPSRTPNSPTSPIPPHCDSPKSGLPFPGSGDRRSPDLPTELDPHETSDGFNRDGRSRGLFDPRMNLVLNFRHSFWSSRRRATFKSLQAAFNQEPSLFGAGGTGFVSTSSFTSSDINLSFVGASLASTLEYFRVHCDELSERARACLATRVEELRATSGLSYVLPTSDTTPLRLLRFAQCGSDSWVMQSLEDPPRFKILSNRCRDRFCEACQRERRRTVSNNVAFQLEGKDLRLLTLTLKSSEDPLRFQLNRLYKSFRLFRQRKAIKRCMIGGLFFVELTLNDRTRLWHPHLHIIFEGTYLPHELIKRSWLSITGDSFIVDVRPIRSSQEAAHYVAKYASKGISQRVWQDSHRMVEAVLALSGRRTFSVFGEWRGLNLSDTPASDCDWVYFGRLDDVIILAKCGDDDCLRIVQQLLDPANPEPCDGIRSPPTDGAR